MAFLGLVSRKPQTPVDERSPFEILKSTVGCIDKLPMFPQAANQAIAVANNPDSSLNDFSTVVERDPILGLGILRLANSPLYRMGKSIDSLRQAVVRLGMRECKNLIVAVGLRSLFVNVDKAKKEWCDVLWRHSFVTACLCRKLNTLMKLGYKGEEFSCGLSHDLGRILLAIGAPSGAFKAADPMDFDESPATLIREREVLGTDHCHFGSWFANMNQLPGSVASAIQYHHEPSPDTMHASLFALVSTADHMANYFQRTNESRSYTFIDNPAWTMLSQNLDPEMLDRISLQAGQLLADAVQEADEVMRF